MITAGSWSVSGNLPDSIEREVDPIDLGKRLWPQFEFYREQQQILRAMLDTDEVYVAAGNKLGKDFTAAFVVLWFFLTRHPCRVITTSAKEDHLRVLWGEIGRFISSAKVSLDRTKGGCLIVNHYELRKIVDGSLCPLSYVRGMVASEDSMAAMGGHHVARDWTGLPMTLFVVDEASSVTNAYMKTASPWAQRILVIGNTWDCPDDSFWRKAIKEGNIADPSQPGQYFRKVFHLTAEHSPNIRLARREIAEGREPSGSVLVPGVLDWRTYLKEQRIWDDIQKTVAHKAEFYEGVQLRLWPPEWLDRCAKIDEALRLSKRRRNALAIGIDPGEGTANSSWTAVDEHGIIEQISLKTKDTSEIPAITKAFGKQHGVDPKWWVFDRGGGGKQHADILRKEGFEVRTVAFGESIMKDIRRGMQKQPYADRLEVREDRYTFVNRRAEMYGEASMICDPSLNSAGFGIPAQLTELIRQLRAMPKMYDNEGRLYLPPKNAKPDSSGKVNEKQLTLTKMLGHSPDEADSFVLAVHGMLHPPKIMKAGAA